jgi:hypothetical protein
MSVVFPIQGTGGEENEEEREREKTLTLSVFKRLFLAMLKEFKCLSRKSSLVVLHCGATTTLAGLTGRTQQLVVGGGGVSSKL